jgi:hypothetical protein
MEKAITECQKMLLFITLENSMDMFKNIYLFDAADISHILGFLLCESHGFKYMLPYKYLLVKPDLTCAFRPKMETGIRPTGRKKLHSYF